MAHGRPALDDRAEAALVTRMGDVLANKKLEFLIGLGADAVAAELVRAR